MSKELLKLALKDPQLARKKIAWAKKKAAMEKPFKTEYSLVKKANLSRAAKGAIGLPLGVMGAAAIHPELFGHVQNVGILDSVAGRVMGSLDNLAKPVLGETLGQSTNALASLGGLSALGAGAGKLSERAIPVAKKSIMDNPTSRKAALAAALFPWTLAVGGGAYLLGKNKSDS